MSRRKKDYKPGDRATIYINKDVTPEMLSWINKQSDLSSFFLYAAKELYNQTGNIDVAEILPRKINFSLNEGTSQTINPNVASHQPTKQTISDEKNVLEKEKTDENWSNLNVDDDPFA